MIISHQQIIDAKRELQKKSRQDIDRETAIVWAARAIAAYRMFLEEDDLSLLIDAVEYHHEAVEHAADTDIAQSIIDILGEEREKAIS